MLYNFEQWKNIPKKISNEQRLVESALVDHAKRELELACMLDKSKDADQKYNNMVAKDVLELIKKFSEQEHSGFSASMVRDTFDKLASWQTLSDITSDPKEWMDVSDISDEKKDTIWQSKRNPAMFSYDKGKTWKSVDENVLNTIKETLLESLVKQDKKSELFDYKNFMKSLWNPIVKEAQEFQKIYFDLENNDAIGDKRKIYIKRDLRVNQPVKYEISCELFRAGGDWQNPIYYFRIQINHDYGIVRSTYYDKPEYVFDKETDYSRPSNCYVMIPPVEAGNKLKKIDAGYSAYDSQELPKSEWKYKPEDFDKMWKWIEDTFETIVEKRHKMIEEKPSTISAEPSQPIE